MKEIHRVSLTNFSRDRDTIALKSTNFWPLFVMAARGLGAIGSVKRTNKLLSGSCEAEEAVEARGHTWWPSGCTWTPSPPHEEMDVNRMSFRRPSHTRVSRASTSGISRFLKQSRRKQSVRIRKCMCLPSNYGLVEFPVVWSELRSVMRCRNQDSHLS